MRIVSKETSILLPTLLLVLVVGGAGALGESRWASGRTAPSEPGIYGAGAIADQRARKIKKDLEALENKIERVHEKQRSREGVSSRIDDHGAGQNIRLHDGFESRWYERSKVTVLLLMKPGRKGIRRFRKSADPLLCSETHCYVSQGAQVPALLMARRRAFGMRNTLGERAWACSNKVRCVFRGVDLSRFGGKIQPVDLRLVFHDKRAARVATPDGTCSVRAGALKCFRGVVANDYAMWLVPERVARKAGSAALAQALKYDVGFGRDVAVGAGFVGH